MKLLEIDVIDTWQTDSIYDTKTLSGGESFLVSLALELALSNYELLKNGIYNFVFKSEWNKIRCG